MLAGSRIVGKQWIWIGVSLFVGCTMGVGLASSGDTEAPPAPATVATAEPTATEPPTATPTAAPETPTPTPEPTASPTPTEPPAPPTATATARPTATPTPEPQTPTPTSTPTPDEALRAFTFCDRLRVDLGMMWGQAPGLAYRGDPRTSGSLEEGDYIRVLTPPNADGEIRVQVYPHDGRAVGNASDRVWISWAQLLPHRLDQIALVCED
ncbi:MAG: hypothetical protein OXG95_06375 [Chloroflexi bacterium]|nr:hypothetical protein [Chloroflexota bacterium]